MKNRRMVTLLFVFLLSAFVFAGCGNTSGSSEATEETQWNEESADSAESSTGEGVASAGDGTEDDAKATTDGTVSGTDGTADGTGTDADGVGEDAEDAADDVGDAAEDIADGAADAVDDVADGVGDAIDNLGGGSFDSYDDAKEYLMEKLQKDNAEANYEVREETEDLTAYNSNDSGAEGYKFTVYETDGGEKIGIYYVDKDTGKIYRYMGKNSIEGY